MSGTASQQGSGAGRILPEPASGSSPFETLLQEAPLGVYVVDAELRVRATTAAARRILGDPPGLLGRELEPLLRELWDAALARRIAARFRRVLASGEPYTHPEWSAPRRDRGVVECYEWKLA